VKSTQAIYPASTKAVGLCKGQRVFPRAALHEIKSEQAWFRRARAVRVGEEPFRVAQRAGSSAAVARAAAAAAEGEAPPDAAAAAAAGTESALYGEWQTEEYVPPAATHGVVPRGGRGHVELWTSAHIPLGTAHLREPLVAQAARKLGVDAAPAMVGFDVRDGRPVPKFDGVVVCDEHAGLLREAAAAMREQAEDKEAHKRRDEALAQWRQLLRAMKVRARIEAEYGGGAT
jgi:xeroderma pigmentosum group C-complementing protein